MLLASAGCGGGDDDDGGVETTLFAADYAGTYTEVRDCRKSSDHDLNNVHIVADPTGLAAYLDRAEAFPTGAVVIKEEYDFADEDCSGDIVQWTVMSKLEAGSSPDTLDWKWQQVGADRTVETEDEVRCINCHTECGVAPGGYEGTCAEP
ncbi:MAG TPA: cytochrome P460 family protein [Kofleriaceae bacterium]|nr:cytochrome P460 family protein [Kofleriaceae bacterium]